MAQVQINENYRLQYYIEYIATQPASTDIVQYIVSFS